MNMETPELVRYGGKHDFEGYVLVLRKQFDDWCKADEFQYGPMKETFGDGYGEPYNPHRMVYGTLKDGRKVYAYLDDYRPPLDAAEAARQIAELTAARQEYEEENVRLRERLEEHEQQASRLKKEVEDTEYASEHQVARLQRKIKACEDLLEDERRDRRDGR